MAKLANDTSATNAERFAANKEVAKYMHPQLKAVDLTSAGEGITFNFSIGQQPTTLDDDVIDASDEWCSTWNMVESREAKSLKLIAFFLLLVTCIVAGRGGYPMDLRRTSTYYVSLSQFSQLSTILAFAYIPYAHRGGRSGWKNNQSAVSSE